VKLGSHRIFIEGFLRIRSQIRHLLQHAGLHLHHTRRLDSQRLPVCRFGPICRSFLGLLALGELLHVALAVLRVDIADLVVNAALGYYHFVLG
jgi:hypothetical protein